MRPTVIVVSSYIVISIIWTLLVCSGSEIYYQSGGLAMKLLGPIYCLSGLFYGHSGTTFSLVAWSIPLIAFPFLMSGTKSTNVAICKIIGGLVLAGYWVGIVLLDTVMNL